VLEYDFESSIGYWIFMTSQAMERALNEELAPLGITHRQFQVLAWLACVGVLSQAELAERMKVEAPTLAGILERMETTAARSWCGPPRAANRSGPISWRP
jgi:MarR family transcriptional regulator for hemolysin